MCTKNISNGGSILEKIVLIDGHSILNRAYYGLPLLTNKDGLHTNAVYGFLNIMFKILDEEEAGYLAVAFDLSAPTFRHKEYKEYKGTRKPMPDELREQIPLIKEVLSAMEIPILSMEGYEADDIIGTVAKRYMNEGYEISVISGDRDLLQLVDEHILVRIPKTSKGTTQIHDYHPEVVKEQYRVTPLEFIDVKALMGDASDNIPGVPSIGEKKATAIIEKFHSIENAYAHVDEVTPASASKALAEHYDSAVFSKWLATIKLDVPIEVSIDELRINNIYNTAAHEMLKKLEFKSLIKRFEKKEISTSGDGFMNLEDSPFANSATANADIACILITEKDALDKMVEELDAAGSFGFDIVGRGGDIVEASICFDETKAYVIKTGHGVSSDDVKFILLKNIKEKKSSCIYLKRQLGCIEDIVNTVGEASVSNKSGDVFAHGRDIKRSAIERSSVVGSAIEGSDTERSATKGSAVEKSDDGDLADGCASAVDIYDCAIAAYLIDPIRDSYEAADIAEHLGIELPRLKDLIGKGTLLECFENPIGQMSLDILSEAGQPKYDANLLKAASHNAYVAYMARDVLEEKIVAMNMKSLFYDVEMPLVYALYEMEVAGIRVDADRLKAYGTMLEADIADVERQIHEDCGKVFNINSPKQLAEVLFEEMKLPGGKKTKSGYSTAADVLEKLAQDYPIVSKILSYRQLTKLNSTYAQGLSSYIAGDGRIHGMFNQTVTATGRISSAEPNLQNIPIRTELGSKLRDVFIPEDGYVFVDADYSQIELRILAALSEDDELIDAYRHAVDVHAVTASRVFHTPIEEVTATQRRNAKAVNFGVVYGISAFGLANDISISRTEAKEYINTYFATYPKVKAYLDNQVAFAKEHGYTLTYFKRRRPIPELKSSNFMQKNFGERIAMNSPLQGTAADIMKIAMIAVNRKLKQEKLDARIVLQVHDELLVEVRKGQEDQAMKILRECMKDAAHLKVELEVDAHIGSSWLEAK